MKKIVTIILSVFMIVTLIACGNQDNGKNNQDAEASNAGTASERNQEPSQEPEETQEEVPEEDADAESETEAQDAEPETEGQNTELETQGEDAKTLVVYYSATNHTETVAEYIANATGGDLFELVPAEPYSDGDLDWTDDNSRVTREHEDPSLRVVELENAVPENWEDYDTVFIGYPIWWGIAAWPVDGFIAANDFTGKTVIPFCTSASSGLGESGQLLEEAAGTGNWLEGQRFSSGASPEDVQDWTEGLGL